ncbi:MAG TPA: glutathione S-transferase family protein [Anaeromyxobacter sp.]
MAHRLKLVSFDLCPYVERSRIVLLEKDVPHEVEFIDLDHKPAWFLAISPMGRVPVLLVDDRPIFESMIINELLDELHPRPTLLPGDPLARAEARSWIVFANDVLFAATLPAMTALAGGFTGDALTRPLGAIRDGFAKLEPQVARAGGPYFQGKAFTLVDAAYAPFFRRWREAERWGGTEARLLAGFPAVSAWAEALLSRPSVVRAAPEEFGPRSRQRFEARAAKARASG